MNSYAKFLAWKGLNSQPKSTRSTTEERRHRRGANDCGRAAAHPRPPPPPKPSLIPFLSWHSIACRCCYGVDVRLPGHREHIRRDSLKPVTYRSERVTIVHLNARSSEVEEVPLILFFCLIDKYSGNFLTPKFSQKNDGELFGKLYPKFPQKNHQKFLDEIFYLYF